MTNPPTPGTIDITSATVGPFVITNAILASKPNIATIDLGLGTVTSAAGGTLTVTFTDVGFNLASGPVTFGISQSPVATSYTAWFDTSNAPFAETTQINTVQNNTATVVDNPVPSANITVTTVPDSVTGQQVFTLGPSGGIYTSDFGVIPRLLPISLTCSSNNSGTVNTPFSSAPAITGGTAPYTFSLASGSLPAGITLNATTGLVSGTAKAAGSFTIKVTDSQGNVATGTCPYTFSNATVTITSSCVTISAVKGVPITSTQLTASGGTGPYTFSAIGLPTGIVLSSTGVLSGTPTVSGTFPYTVTITDSQKNKGTINCSITVTSPPPILSRCAAINAIQNMAITPVTLTATGGTGTGYTFSATGLPTGLTISSGGTISGTPTVSGTYAYVVTIRDSAGNTGTLNCSVYVEPSNSQNGFTVTCPKGTADVGAAYTSSVVATGGTPPYTYSVSAGSLPAGLTLNATTGVISGTPTTAGTSGFTIKVVDSTGKIAYSSCSGACATMVTSTLNFNSPSGDLGDSHTYTIGTTNVTAYGFMTSGSPTALYAQGNGIGIASVKNQQTDQNNFVQIDLTQALSAGATAGQLLLHGLNQCQNGESYDIYGSNTLGQLGTLLISQGTTNGTFFSIPSFGTYKYISIKAHSGNILVGELSLTLPGTTCSIVVAPALSVQCPSSSATAGQFYSSTIVVTGGTPPYTFSVSWGSLPAGLSLNTSTGVISGTPTTQQTGSFQIKVVDSNGAVGYSGSSGSCSSGTTVSYGQNGYPQQPDGDRGNSYTWTSNGLPLTVYGWGNDGSQAHIYAGNDWNSPGLGIDGGWGNWQNQIDTDHFVQFDLSTHTGNTGVWLNINSNDQWGATYDVYGSNTPGSRGTLLQSNQNPYATNPIQVPNTGNYRYLCITAHSGHVVVGNINFTYPAKCAIDVGPAWGQSGWGNSNGWSNGGYGNGGWGQSGFGNGSGQNGSYGNGGWGNSGGQGGSCW